MGWKVDEGTNEKREVGIIQLWEVRRALELL